MKKLLAIIGLVLLTPSAAAAPLQSGISVYREILDTVRREASTAPPTTQVEQYVLAVLRDKGLDVSEDAVREAIKGNRARLCAAVQALAERNKKSFLGCENELQLIRTLMRDEESLHALGHSLQLIASSYELPTDALPAGTEQGTGYRSIIEFWRAGNGVTESGSTLPHVRILPLPDIAEEMSALSFSLESLTEEQRIAAVWHYLNGVEYVSGNRPGLYGEPDADDPDLPENAADTERQYRFLAQDGVESALRDILAVAQGAAGGANPPVGEDEVILFRPAGMLGNGVLVWVRSDDVGLQFELPTEPTPPSLVGFNSGKPILGGLFPPPPRTTEDGEPDDSTGVCTHPYTEDGYLCRPLDVDAVACREDVEPDPDSTILTACADPKDGDRTYAGPDVCHDIAWRDGGFDPEYQCTVAIGCRDVCQGTDGGPSPDELWHTYSKKPDGQVDVCLRQDSPVPHAYIALAGLTAAYHICGLPMDAQFVTGDDEVTRLASCCGLYAAGARTMCEAMEHDGVFNGEEGGRAEIDGYPLDVRACVDAEINEACQTTCFREVPEAVVEAIKERASANPANLPDPCDDLFDQRLIDLKTAAERRDDIAERGRAIRFPNTIGNGVCALGEYLEESLEMHNLVPGAHPMVTQDQAYPNESRIGDAPLAGSRLDTPSIPPILLPPYRPHALVQAYDVAVCQLNGLPPGTPPALCAFDPSRRFALPLDSFLLMARNITEQKGDYASPLAGTERLAMGVGSKMGAELYGRYLKAASKALAETINLAGQVLEQMKAVEFPQEMCPLGDQPVPESDEDADSDDAEE